MLRRQKEARIENVGESKTARQHRICTDLFKTSKYSILQSCVQNNRLPEVRHDIWVSSGAPEDSLGLVHRGITRKARLGAVSIDACLQDRVSLLWISSRWLLRDGEDGSLAVGPSWSTYTVSNVELSAIWASRAPVQLTMRVNKMKEQRKKYLVSQIFHRLHYTTTQLKMASRLGLENWWAGRAAFTLLAAIKDDFPTGKGLGNNCPLVDRHNSRPDILYFASVTTRFYDYLVW